MRSGEPRFGELVKMVEEFNLATVRRFVELGVEWISYPEDLGMQKGPMLSPDQFRRFIHQHLQRLADKLTPNRRDRTECTIPVAPLSNPQISVVIGGNYQSSPNCSLIARKSRNFLSF